MYLAALKRYATVADLSSIPSTILFTYTEKSLTVFDKFPKSPSFHFLLLPRVTSSLSEEHVRDLRTLLNWDKEKARLCLEGLAKDAEHVEQMIKQEMRNRYGFEWAIFTGFHAVPSMEHLHLHIIASDLFSDSLKKKRHYNSFHPNLGFFLHLKDVLSWFDTTPSYYETMAKIPKSQYEPLLKEDLVCWLCDQVFKTIPKLKEHLKEKWEKDAARARAKAHKRKREQDDDDTPKDKPPAKTHVPTSEAESTAFS